MTTTTTVFALLGLGLGGGLLAPRARVARAAPTLAATRVRRSARGSDAARRGGRVGRRRRRGRDRLGGRRRPRRRSATWSLPAVLARDRAHARRVARIEAIATWAEMMRDTLAAAAGLEQAILASAAVAPAAIHAEITGLAVRLETGHRLAPSLQRLADELADPTADLVISSLLLAATQQARHVSDLLGSLATTAREQASMRLRIEAGRARSRTSVRIIVGTTVAFAVLLVLLNREYLAAYDSLTGQLVLLVIGAMFAAGFLYLAKIAAVDEPTRLLAGDAHTPKDGAS